MSRAFPLCMSESLFALHYSVLLLWPLTVSQTHECLHVAILAPSLILKGQDTLCSAGLIYN